MPSPTAPTPFPESPDPRVPALAVARGVSAVCLSQVTVRAGAQRLLDRVSLSVGVGEHWAVLGANGAGKTTLLDVVQGAVEPASGSVLVLGERHGAHGFAAPRLRIGVVDSAPPAFASRLTATEVVVLRSAGPPALRGSRVAADEVENARATLALVGCGDLVDRPYASCSHGERQRINLARALQRAPAIVLLDEPAAGLDLPGRAALLASLEELVVARPDLATITVTHHLEELPGSTTHAALLRGGALLAQGPVGEVLTNDRLSRCFGVPVEVTAHDRGWSARVGRASWARSSA